MPELPEVETIRLGLTKYLVGHKFEDVEMLSKGIFEGSAKQISKEETKRLFDSILEVLNRGLKYGGASELTFVNVLGQEGEYQMRSLVYGKKGKPCPNGNGEIKKIFLGGRGTFFCSSCQR